MINIVGARDLGTREKSSFEKRLLNFPYSIQLSYPGRKFLGRLRLARSVMVIHVARTLARVPAVPSCQVAPEVQ